MKSIFKRQPKKFNVGVDIHLFGEKMELSVPITGALLGGVAALISASQGKQIARINADASVEIARSNAESQGHLARVLENSGIVLSEERQKTLKWVAIAAAALILILIIKK